MHSNTLLLFLVLFSSFVPTCRVSVISVVEMSVARAFWKAYRFLFVLPCSCTRFGSVKKCTKNKLKTSKCDICKGDSVSVSSTEGTGEDTRSFLDAIIADMKCDLSSKFDIKIGEVGVEHNILSAGSGAEGVVWEVSLIGIDLLISAKVCKGSATEAAQ